MLVDTTYLSLHPATVAWFDRRKRCASCAHCLLAEAHLTVIMRCPAAPQVDALARARAKRRATHEDHLYCIDASADSGPCGADAKLWKEQKA